MNPAFSVVIFTTLAGAAQGLVVAVALAFLVHLPSAPATAPLALLLAGAMLLAGLGASFLHLGRPERAWRAATMWRTSWLSREVLALPAFIVLVAAWWQALRIDAPAALTHLVAPLLALLGATVLWVCTAMIYACLRFVEEWAHPLTFVNFVLTGLSSGFVLAASIGSLSGDMAFVRLVGPMALGLTLAAWAARAVALHRNAAIRHQSTLQSATGIRAAPLQQKSMGMSAGSFNTREFFHHEPARVVRLVRIGLVVFGFALPASFALVGVLSGSPQAFCAAVLSQALGLVADRWYFFAEAKHPQNLYYQVIS